MSVQTHSTVTKTADLDGEFGFNLAVKKLGITVSQLEQLLGRYVKGKNTGKLKGCLVWDKTEIGGWDYGSRSVKLPGSRNYRICTKTWLGAGWRYDPVYTEKIVETVTIKPEEYIYDIRLTDSWDRMVYEYRTTLSNTRDIAEEFNDKNTDLVRKINHDDIRIKTNNINLGSQVSKISNYRVDLLNQCDAAIDNGEDCVTVYKEDGEIHSVLSIGKDEDGTDLYARIARSNKHHDNLTLVIK